MGGPWSVLWHLPGSASLHFGGPSPPNPPRAPTAPRFALGLLHPRTPAALRLACYKPACACGALVRARLPQTPGRLRRAASVNAHLAPRLLQLPYGRLWRLARLAHKDLLPRSSFLSSLLCPSSPVSSCPLTSWSSFFPLVLPSSSSRLLRAFFFPTLLLRSLRPAPPFFLLGLVCPLGPPASSRFFCACRLCVLSCLFGPSLRVSVGPLAFSGFFGGWGFGVVGWGGLDQLGLFWTGGGFVCVTDRHWV
ncbi:hypothetical protein EV192_1021118 [Actinocrispum wychmicini]|uniref:Uncharacterized protein n=1 Tax=Actinocrispum wychmicini TaxID=1213861 RepID=A0A4R2JZV5_9PSEU|nr:hypothetical protein EV192_1021118 [Actinocrispum wychmicini]